MNLVATGRTATAVEESPQASMWGTDRPLHHDKGLLLIGFFKLLEAAFFVAVGLGALHFLHRNLGDAMLKLAMRLRMDPEGRLVSFLLDSVDSLTQHRLKQIGLATFLYALVRVTEGVGLVLEKLWAEYLTVGVTVSFLPWELYEIFRQLDWIRFSLLVINVAVLVYLLWQLRRKRQQGLLGS